MDLFSAKLLHLLLDTYGQKYCDVYTTLADPSL